VLLERYVALKLSVEIKQTTPCSVESVGILDLFTMLYYLADGILICLVTKITYHGSK